jgi:predicted site-specific integrase-resolvase
MSRSQKLRPAPLTLAELDTLPVALNVADLARIFGVSLPTIYGYHHSGKLRRFQLAKPIGTRRWSGRLVKEFLNGEGNALEAIRRRTA